MFGRPKKPDGFEWHKYIRTSIRLRRERRRERILEVRRAAAEQAGAAGAALAQGSRAAGAALAQGSRAAGASAWASALAGLGVTWLLLQALCGYLWEAVRAGGRSLALRAQPLSARLAEPRIGRPVALAGAVALALGIGRASATSLDGAALLMLAIGAVLLIASAPLLLGAASGRAPSLAKLGVTPRTALTAAATVGLAMALAWVATGDGRAPLADLAGQLPRVGGAKPLQGRARALDGDLVRVAGTTVRLSGIEAPERQQMCGPSNRRFRCGAAAHAALGRLVDGRRVSCTLSGTDASGRPLANCMRGALDINAELVRQGHAFAESGMFASYSGLEREARAAKAGIWAGGEAERPAEFRAKVWEEAKRHAPDGCPIKGRITGGARVYVLPWSPDYERGRIEKARGERWFCSEQEAVAAGWKPAAPG
jgi:endonuclease YncB( thermonuclease family)